MIIDTKAILKQKDQEFSSSLLYENRILSLNINGYILENYSRLNQHWEISDESFKKSGNKLNFDLTDFPNDITNFDLFFTLNTSVDRGNSVKDIQLSFHIKYSGMNIEIRVFEKDNEHPIAISWGLENIYEKLRDHYKKSNASIRSCFNCNLSGYEKGGNTLFCFKDDKVAFLSKPFIEQYQDFYVGLEKDVTTEFYLCSEFEFNTQSAK